MHSDRRTVFQLLAAGRITPAQAERLIAVSNDGRETLWTVAACAAAAGLAQFQPHMLGHLFKALVPLSLNLTHYAATLVAALQGGIQ